MSGFSPSFISQVENGQASPSINSLQHICTALRVTDRNLTAGLVTLRKATSRPLSLSLVAAGKILVEPER